MIHFVKYQALGNDYLVINPAETGISLNPAWVRRICDRHYGPGSDGILLGPIISSTADFAVRIFNPDGSEAEKSGNGLRIFASYLWDTRQVQERPFTVETKGGIVRVTIQPGGRTVSVEMGRVSFNSLEIPVTGPEREVIDEVIRINDQEFHYCALTIGNPHCVVLYDEISPELATTVGPIIEREERFPNRTNVQFVKVLDRQNIQIEIWERGAGYTLASGSSSCAAASAIYRLGLCEPEVVVHSPGGKLDIAISVNGFVLLTGPVTRVYEGIIAVESLDQDF